MSISAMDKTLQPVTGLKHRLVKKLLYCTGDMEKFHTFVQDKAFPLQMFEWCLRGVSGVIMVNNPISGALIIAAITFANPWQALLGSLGLVSSTITAILIGQDRVEVSCGHYGYNGMLVALLIGVFNSAGDWYWMLLLPVCISAITTTFLSIGLSSVLGRLGLPVSVFPFNTVLLLYLSCMGLENPNYPNYAALPLGEPLSLNSTGLHLSELLKGAVLAVGQIFACDVLGSSLLILGAVFLFSPILAIRALLGSGIGILAGLSASVRHKALYSGLASFNGALGCMSIGDVSFDITWRKCFLSIVCAFLSSYVDIALCNILANVDLPASSWAATLTSYLMLLVIGQKPSSYSLPPQQDISPPEHVLQNAS